MRCDSQGPDPEPKLLVHAGCFSQLATYPRDTAPAMWLILTEKEKAIQQVSETSKQLSFNCAT